jgi:purine-binding chemotaxis protein CheW
MIRSEFARTQPDRQRNSAGPLPEHGIFTMLVGGETFGLPVSCVNTIFRATVVTRVPLGPREVVGLVNLRGEIVTAVSLRLRLGLNDPGPHHGALAIGIEYQGETVALFVDEVGDVITVSEDTRIAAPPNFPAGRLELTADVYRLDSRILPVLDLTAILRFTPSEVAAA